MPAEPAPRLLYVVTSLNGGGAEGGLVNLVRGGAFAGFELTIAALVRGADVQTSALAALGCAPEVLVERLRPGPVALWLSAWRLRRLMRAQAPHVLVLSLPHANLLGRALRPRRPRPLVLSFEHNSRLARKVYETGYRLSSGRVDWTLADCRATADEALGRLYRRRPARVDVLPLVDFTPDRLAAASSRPPPGAPLRLVSAARLSRTKNAAHLVAMVEVLRRTGLDVELTLFGDGPLRPELQAQIAAADLGEAVVLAGRTARWWETPADLFVLASRHEGLCIAALEALATGLPVAAPWVGGLAEYGADAGIIVLGGTDPAADAHVIAAALADPARMRARAEAGRATVGMRYGSDVVHATYRRFNDRLHQLIEQRRG